MYANKEEARAVCCNLRFWATSSFSIQLKLVYFLKLMYLRTIWWDHDLLYYDGIMYIDFEVDSHFWIS